MNKSNSILLIDPSFDPAAAPNCTLLVKVGLDSFSYAIIDKETNAVSAVFDEQECKSGALKFAERLKTDSYLTLAYQDVKVAIHTPNMINIPNDLFREEELSAHAQFFATPHSENVYAHTQSYFGFTTIFSLPTPTEELLHNFKGKKFQSTAGLLSLAEDKEETTLILDFTVTSFTALYLKNKQVIFQQCYEIENMEEFNYYLLLMVNQLQISTQDTKVHLSGIVHEGDETYNCIQKYFNHIEFISALKELNQQVLNDMPFHYYSSLLALDQCE